MFKKIMQRVRENEKGITGLETAIILIAFVVVAAVFAYTVLSAGLFSTQKSQQAVYSGLKQAQSTIEIKGSIVAKSDTANEVSQLTFTVANPTGGEDIDFTPPTVDTSATGVAKSGSSNVIVISYMDANQRVQDLYWTFSKLYGTSGNVLKPGEEAQITIGGDTTGSAPGSLVDALTTQALGANTTFTISLKTATGAVLQFQRTTPAQIDSVMMLN